MYSFSILNKSLVPCLVLTIASWPAHRFLRRQGRWPGIPMFLRILQFVVIHTVKGFSIVNEAEVDVFLEFSCFFYDPAFFKRLRYESKGFPNGSAAKESTCNVGDTESIPESWGSPGGRFGNPLQNSCWENPMDRRTWQFMGSQSVGHTWRDWAHTWEGNALNINLAMPNKTDSSLTKNSMTGTESWDRNGTSDVFLN